MIARHTDVDRERYTPLDRHDSVSSPPLYLRTRIDQNCVNSTFPVVKSGRFAPEANPLQTLLIVLSSTAILLSVTKY